MPSIGTQTTTTDEKYTQTGECVNVVSLVIKPSLEPTPEENINKTYDKNKCRCRVVDSKGVGRQCSYKIKTDKFGGLCTLHKNEHEKNDGKVTFKGYINEKRPESWGDCGLVGIQPTQIEEMKRGDGSYKWAKPRPEYIRDFKKEFPDNEGEFHPVSQPKEVMDERIKQAGNS